MWLMLACLVLTTMANGAWGDGDRVRLQDVQSLSLRHGLYTAGRRTPGVLQLQCRDDAGAGAAVLPSSAQCTNEGLDDRGVVQWRCEAELPNYLRFGRIEVECEGYEHPEDPWILRGSCGLLYTLERQDPYSNQKASPLPYYQASTSKCGEGRKRLSKGCPESNTDRRTIGTLSDVAGAGVGPGHSPATPKPPGQPSTRLILASLVGAIICGCIVACAGPELFRPGTEDVVLSSVEPMAPFRPTTDLSSVTEEEEEEEEDRTPRRRDRTPRRRDRTPRRRDRTPRWRRPPPPSSSDDGFWAGVALGGLTGYAMGTTTSSGGRWTPSSSAFSSVSSSQPSSSMGSGGGSSSVSSSRPSSSVGSGGGSSGTRTAVGFGGTKRR